MRHLTTALLAATLFAGIASAGPHEDAIIAADRAFNDLAQSEGVAAAFRAFSADDGRMFAGTGDLIQGPAPIGDMMAAIYGTSGKLSWTPTEAVASADGTLGYTFGRFAYDSGAPGPDGKHMAFNGTYITVWQLQADGTYKFDFDLGAPDAGPAP